MFKIMGIVNGTEVTHSLVFVLAMAYIILQPKVILFLSNW